MKNNTTDYPLFRDSDNCCTDIAYDGYGNSGIITDDESYLDEYKRSKGLNREDLI